MARKPETFFEEMKHSLFADATNRPLIAPVIPSQDFMILRLTTVHENAGSAGILPAVGGRRVLDDVAGRMPALPFPWRRGISL
jgi:hypothetical protein